MSKIFIVAKQTYINQAKSMSFALMLVLPFLIFIGSLGFGYFNSNNSTSNIGIVQNGINRSSLKEYKNFVDVNSISDAKKMVKNDDIDGYLVVNKKNEKFSGFFYGNNSSWNENNVKVKKYINNIQSQLNIQNSQLSKKQMQNLLVEPILVNKTNSDVENKQLSKFISFYLFILITYLVVLIYSSIISQETASEKGTKIIEVILSSIEGKYYFWGKMLGLLGLIATQIFVYVFIGFLGYKIAMNSEMIDYSNKQIIYESLSNISISLIMYLIFGILIFIILSAYCGAISNTKEDAAKASQPVVILSIMIFFSSIFLESRPESIIVKIMSYVPLLSSYFMPLRIINNSASIVEINISMFILLVTIVISMLYLSKNYHKYMLEINK